jgi:hypothetical protein
MNNQETNPQNEGEKLTSIKKKDNIKAETSTSALSDVQSKTTDSAKTKSKKPYKFKRKRDGRVPFDKKRKLSFRNKRKDFSYHWMNEDSNDFTQLQEDGYAFVDETDHEPRDASMPSQDGKIVKRSVGGGKYAYLMCIPQKWQNEYDAEKQKVNDRIMRDIGKVGIDSIPMMQQTGSIDITQTSKVVEGDSPSKDEQ